LNINYSDLDDTLIEEITETGLLNSPSTTSFNGQGVVTIPILRYQQVHNENKRLKSELSITKQKNQILEEKIIFEWFFQMIKGLAFLHSKLIIHLNLKPK
jgi:serine/threonine protein kinase